MSARAWLAASLLGSAVLAARAAGAQTVHRDCDGDTLAARTAAELGAATFRLTPDETWRRLGRDTLTAPYGALGDTVRRYFQALATDMDAGARERMTLLIDTLGTELRRLDTDPEYRRTAGPTVRLFEITRPFDPGEPWIVNEGTPGLPSIEISEATPVPTRRAVCWTALLARRVADAGSAPARESLRRFLAERAARWENFERTGYSMLPLELLVNGLCTACRAELEPPRIRIIAAHISPAYLVRSASGSRPALAAEVAGFLHHYDEWRSHWGMSLVVAYPQGERRQYGPMLHWSGFGQVAVTTAGDRITWRTTSLLLSADLYRFIARRSGELQEERETVRAALARLGVGG